MYSQYQRRLEEQVRLLLLEQYQLELPSIVIEQPPKVELGEFALPLAFELARRLRKAPRKIAEEIVAGLGPVEGFHGFEVAGAGYINARLDRAAAASAVQGGSDQPQPSGTWQGEKILVERLSTTKGR